MWIEQCNIPSNTFSWLDIQLPQELKNEVIQETHNELIECSVDSFIEGLGITGWNDVFTSIFRDTLRRNLIEEWKLYSKLDEAYIYKTIWDSLTEFEWNGWLEYDNLKQDISQSYIVINWVSINFNELFLNYAPREVWRPVSRAEIQNNIIPSWDWLEPEGWFQRDENSEWKNLSDLIEEVWLWRDFIMFFLYELKFMELDSQQLKDVGLLVRYIAEAESWGWYNRSHDDWFPGSGWYFEYQKNDWKKWWERLNSEEKYESLESEPDVKDNKVREVWLQSSYDQALKRLPESTRKSDEKLQQEFDNIWNPEKQDMASLSAVQQIKILLSDLYFSPNGKELFEKLFSWDKTAIIDIYTQLHHTDFSNQDTARLVMRLNKELLWIYPRPVSRPDNLWNDVMAENN